MMSRVDRFQIHNGEIEFAFDDDDIGLFQLRLYQERFHKGTKVGSDSMLMTNIERWDVETLIETLKKGLKQSRKEYNKRQRQLQKQQLKAISKNEI